MAEPVGFEHLLSDLSSRFSGIAFERVDGEIDRALERLVGFLGADRGSFLELLPDDGALSIAHSWARPGLAPAATATPVAATFPWYYERLRQGEAIRIERLPDQLPKEAVAERAYSARLPMRSQVVVPLLVDRRWVCALLAATAERERSWTDAEVECIRIVGQVVANAIHRRKLERALRGGIEELRRRQRRLEGENEILRGMIGEQAGFEQIAGGSRALRDVVDQAARVAPTDAAVLLLGETGTGKERLARAIHAGSARAKHPLVVVNCTALPQPLLESELFGHEKGAFTGAASAKRGRFELADGGTLFLDEAGELPPEVQVKLLRVLQDGELQRQGSVHARRVDVRVLAATRCNLELAMAEGRFREDLYYRLAMFPIELPPLRERREDIPLLVWDIIERRQDELGRRIDRVPESGMRALVQYAWPGNVRELANVIERSLILSDGPVLRLDAFLSSQRPRPGPSDRLVDLERAHCLRVLERCQWRINGPGNAAEALGLRPSTLRSRLKKLGVVRPSVSPEA